MVIYTRVCLLNFKIVISFFYDCKGEIDLVERYPLKNGLEIAFENMSGLRSVSFGVWVGAGTRFETKKENGISHFIEHLIFKGTGKRTAKDIAQQMDAMGGQINAYTTKEYTCYYTRVLDKHFESALEILSDMVLSSSFSEDNIEKEKKVIEEEIDMYLDAPEELVHDALEEGIGVKQDLECLFAAQKNHLMK